MELIAPRPPVTARFDVSLPYDIFTSLILLDTAQQCSGVSEWIVQTRTRLPAELAGRAHLLVGALRYASLLWGHLTAVAEDDPARRAFAPFLRHVSGLSGAAYRELALDSVGQRLASWQIEPDPARRTTTALGRYRRRLIGYLDELKVARQTRRPGLDLTEPDSALLADLLLDGEALKEQIVTTLEEFWQRFYRERFFADLPLLDAAVARHRRQAYPADFPALLQAIVGRSVPEVMARYLDGIAHVDFVPNAHIGPFLVFTPTPPVMTIAFNALAQPVQAPGAAPDSVTQRLYPALDALADETRLKIVTLLHEREWYAQEIAQALGLSQSVISRHLHQLEEAGLVRVRREGTSKYYALDIAHGQTVIASLKELIGVR